MDRSVLEIFEKVVQKQLTLKSAEELAELINLLSQSQRAQLISLLLCASQGEASHGLMFEVQAALR